MLEAEWTTTAVTSLANHSSNNCPPRAQEPYWDPDYDAGAIEYSFIRLPANQRTRQCQDKHETRFQKRIRLSILREEHGLRETKPPPWTAI